MSELPEMQHNVILMQFIPPFSDKAASNITTHFIKCNIPVTIVI
jgi:predicted phosphohydrolase